MRFNTVIAFVLSAAFVASAVPVNVEARQRTVDYRSEDIEARSPPDYRRASEGGPVDYRRGGPVDYRRGGPVDYRRGGPVDYRRGGPVDYREASPPDYRREASPPDYRRAAATPPDY